MKFRPSARLQRYLGQELIADPNLAVLEFVKNSYDAGATQVNVRFALTSDPTSLTIADNGVGMDQEGFQENWMRPGFSSKAPDAPVSTSQPRTAAERLASSRVPVGEKGLGRLAAGRLGERMHVYTRRHKNRPWLHVLFEWSDFDDMTKSMDEIDIPFDFDTAPADADFATGTVVVIEQLRQRWDMKLRGRPVAGRSRTKLGRLRQDLQYLTRPLGNTSANFSILLESDSVAGPDDVGHILSGENSETGDYVYTFTYKDAPSAVGPRIYRHIDRSTTAARLAQMEQSEDLGTVDITRERARAEGRPTSFTCGPFHGVFVYTPPPAARRAREIDATATGVTLYRDGVMVEPYGLDGNDWVGVEARKAQRQGHAAIQPNTFTGHVEITRDGNPRLRDMSNRLGLLDTQESEDFIAHVRAEFRVFEDLVYEEVLEQRWEGREAEKASRQASETATTSSVFLRALAHSIRQPLVGLSLEVSNLDTLTRRGDIPQEVRGILTRIHERARSFIDNAELAISDVLDFEDEEFSEVPVAQTLEQVRAKVGELAESKGVALQLPANPPELRMLVPPVAVVQGVGNVVANAIEASDGSDRRVSIAALDSNGDVLLSVTDNAGGIADWEEDMDLEDVKSSKGRPARGLVMADLLIRHARGRVLIARSDESGTQVDIYLPTRAAGLRTKV